MFETTLTGKDFDRVFVLKVIVAVPLEIPAIVKEICPFEFVSPPIGETTATDSLLLLAVTGMLLNGLF